MRPEVPEGIRSGKYVSHLEETEAAEEVTFPEFLFQMYGMAFDAK